MPRVLPPGPSTRRRLGNVLLLLGIASLIFGLLLSVFRTVEAERELREQVAQTNAVLFDLRQVSRSALNGETGQRGYLLTLDRRYLAPYLAARAEYGPALDRLRKSVGSSPTSRQRALLDEIEELTRAKFAELDRTVALVDQRRLLDARAVVLTDEGLEAMARLRAATREMEEIESRILRDAIAQTARAEARLLPLLGLLTVALVVLLLLGYRLIVRTAQAEAEAEGAAALAAARDRADLLAKELNHRVKNLFAVVLAIVQMTGRGQPEAKPVVDRIAERIRALLTAHEVTQGAGGRSAATLGRLVETTLAPYRSAELRAVLEGPEVPLSDDSATPLGLMLHEMTTNAVKYGAWAHGGTIAVRWRVEDGTVRVHWRETGAPVAAPPEREGFGTALMTSSARQLEGTVERRFGTDGVEVDIAFPVQAAANG